MATRKRSSSKRSTRSSKEKTKVRVNMKGVEGRTSTRFKPGDYAAKIIKAVAGESSEKKTPQVMVTFQITDGKYKGKKSNDAFYLTKNALWRFRNLLEAAGVKIPKGIGDIDLTKLKGKEVAITFADDEYENKIRSRVTDVFPVADLRELEDEDDELDEDEDEEDEDEEDDDEDEDDEDEDEEDDEDEDDEDEDEDEDEDDEDEDEDDDLEDVDLDDDDD